MKLVSWVFFFSLAISSVYVWPSGNAQPADFLLALASGFVIVIQMRTFRGIAMLWPMVALTLWVFIVSATWSVLHPSGEFFRYPLFYTFNLVFMLAVVNLFLRLHDPRLFFRRAIEAALLVSGVGILISLAMPGFGLTAEARVSGRLMGFFNNPNQLAYHSLCMMGAWLVLNEGRTPRRIIDIVALTCGVLGVFLAASLGAMAGFAWLLLAIFLANSKSAARLGKAIGGVLLTLALVFGFEIYTEGAMIDRVQARMERLERKLEDLESERGYHRINAHREYLILGAAEGSVERFPGYGTHEIHSSFGTLVFSYGVIGVVLFLLILWRAVRRAPVYVWLVLAAPLTYSITHMGLRSTAFWLLVVLVTVIYWGKSTIRNVAQGL